MQMMAVYRPRVFIIEAGDSFRLLGEHFARLGLSVNQVTLKPQVDVSLPPYADALRLLEGRRRIDPTAGLDVDEAGGGEQTPTMPGAIWLGEMEIATRIMVTGGEVREDNRMTRADRLLIREAILQAAVSVRIAGRAQVLTEDVVRALREVPTARRERAAEIADALALFTSAGSLEAHFFNRPGAAWPEADVTIFEMGILAQEGYEDKLTLAYVGLMNRIHALIERLQYQDRPTLVLTDEAHLITTNALLAPYVVKITKMWRKLGTWLWLATQNLEDFPAAAKRMLNMMEWWVCLSMPPEEVESIARFKELTDEEKRLLARRAQGAGALYRRGGAGKAARGALSQRAAPACACPCHDREAREGGAPRASCASGAARSLRPPIRWPSASRAARGREGEAPARSHAARRRRRARPSRGLASRRASPRAGRDHHRTAPIPWRPRRSRAGVSPSSTTTWTRRRH